MRAAFRLPAPVLVNYRGYTPRAMKPARFDYCAVRTAEEAVSALAQSGGEAKVLAGGQSLVPAMNFRLARPPALVDINRVGELGRMTDEGDCLRVGAVVRHAAFEQPVDDGPLGRLLAMAARHVGHLPIRIRGTFGGSLAHADPAAEWCVIAALLDAEIVAASAEGVRRIPASDFFLTVFTTALEPAELLTEVRLPKPAPSAKIGFQQFSRRAGDFALTMAAAVLEVEGGKVAGARIALGGVGDRPVRACGAEELLRGERASPRALAAAAEAAARGVDPIGDIHGSAEYRRDLVRVLTRRALEQAAAQ